MITLIGATGFTGTLIAHELKRLGCSARLAARDPAKLERLLGELGGDFETVLVDVIDPSTIPRAFEGSGVVINCAGPFTDLGVPVVAEAARRGVHYLDTTGEQDFIRRVFEEFDRDARSTGAALVPACAFEYALGDVAAELAAEDLQPCDEVEIAYAIEGFGTSRGTKKSIIKAMSTDGCQYRNSNLVQSRSSAVRREVNFPGIGRRTASSFPAGEVIMVPRHVATTNVTTLMVLPIPAPIAAAASLIIPALLRSPLAGPIFRAIERGSLGPSFEERQKSVFTIVATARRGRQSRTATVTGRDPYGLTATIASHIALLLDKGNAKNVGAVSPSMVAGREAIIKPASGAGVAWQVGEIATA